MTGAARRWWIAAPITVIAMALLAMALSRAWAQAPAAPPAPVSAPAPAADEELYRRALALQAAARVRGDEARARKAGSDLLRRLAAEHPGSARVDDAALLLIEDGFCLTDAGYPECVGFAIEGYEAFLRAYPYSDRRSRVLRQLVERYLELSSRYEQERPWNSPERAELCRGRALEIAERLAANPELADSAWARATAAGIRNSGKPFSIVPGGGLPR